MINFLSKNMSLRDISRREKKYLCLILIVVISFNFVFLPLTAFAQTPGTPEGGGITPEAAKQVGATTPEQIKKIDTTSAQASGTLMGWLAGELLLFISGSISNLLGAFFGMILYIEAQIIDYLLSPNYFSFTNAKVVQVGWGITRDLANMFFILILLIIAFATVLRRESYGIKKLLPKLIFAALLINFSLVIAGFIIDFAQVLTVFFIKQGIGSDFGTITTKLASSMDINNFYNPSQPGSIGQGLAQLGTSSIAAVVGIILTLIGLVITVFVFGATAVFLVVRIVNIWGLLIIAPIVIILGILPATSSYFSKWWDAFIKWAFFAPAYAFFIYLSLQIFDGTGKLVSGTFSGAVEPNGWNVALPGLTTVSLPSAIFQWILVIALMFYSLTVAQQLGVKVAASSEKILRGWGEKSKNWAGRLARRGYVGATRPEAPTPPPAGASMGQRFKYRFRQVGAAVGRGTLAVPGLREQQMKYMGEENAAYKAAYDKYKGLDPVLLNQVAAGVIVDPRARLAVQQLQIEKDQLKPGADETLKLLDRAKGYGQEAEFVKIITGKLGQEGWKPANGFTAPVMANLLNRAEHDPNLEQGLLKQINEEMKKDLTAANGYDNAARTNLLRRAQKYGKEKDFLKFFPNLAPTIGKNIKDTVAKIENAADIYEDQLVSDVVRELNPDQLKDIARKGGDAKMQKVKDIVDIEFRGLAPTHQSEINRIINITNKEQRNQELQQFLDLDLSLKLAAGIPRDVAQQEVRKLEKTARNRATMESPSWQI